jgi:hypothetical protein
VSFCEIWRSEKESSDENQDEAFNRDANCGFILTLFWYHLFSLLRGLRRTTASAPDMSIFDRLRPYASARPPSAGQGSSGEFHTGDTFDIVSSHPVIPFCIPGSSSMSAMSSRSALSQDQSPTDLSRMVRQSSSVSPLPDPNAFPPFCTLTKGSDGTDRGTWGVNAINKRARCQSEWWKHFYIYTEHVEDVRCKYESDFGG